MESTDTTKTVEALRQQIDALAMAVMFHDDASDAASSNAVLAATLSTISEQANIAGWESVATLASELRRGLLDSGGAPDDHTATQSTLQAGIGGLQAALERAARGEVSDTSAEAQLQNAAATQPLALPPNFDLELLTDFFLEAREHLSNIETQLLALEQDPNNHDAVHTIFRGFHTIKGLAGFLELAAIQSVAHEVETVLDLARNDKLAITPEVIDVVLAASDYLKTELQNSEAAARNGNAGVAADSTRLLSRIQGLAVAEKVAAEKPVAVAEKPAAAEKTAVPEPEAAPEPQQRENEPASKVAPEAPVQVEAKKQSAEARAIKVDTAKLDFLVDMVGEMVIAQSLLRHDTSLINPRLLRNLTQLSRITGEVQKTAMSMRMVPIGQLFSRMARLVRDLSRKEGKQAELAVSGEDTELDRTIVEDLSDPLMHMVRNSADHGIEPIEERIKAGKNPAGRISLKAYHQAGFITIEVSDDGRGLDRDKLLKKARQKGLVDDGSELTDREVFNLIFEPGFSTAEQVTDISGRGVGMDVVRRQVQKMRGRIDIQSQKGVGTTFFIKLPLTLAIIDGLVIGVGRERYVVPIFAVREMFRPAPEAVKTVQGRSEMVLVRNNLLPIVRLHQRFNVEPKTTEVSQSLLIVAETSGKSFCLMVDEFIGKQEVVIKSLGERFKDVTGVAGGAILGDGRVGLILDMDGLHA
jgi:two-component system, chemotaxis family, sensor kinase CheA